MKPNSSKLMLCRYLLFGCFLITFLVGKALADDYRLGAEDTLNVTVLRHPELSAESIEVGQDGKILLPMAGSVIVAGKTCIEAANAITSALSARLVSPEVTVSVTRPRSERVFVLGAVTHSGVYDMKQGWRVTEALAAAGGMTTRPELSNASILRLNRETIRVDLSAALSGDSDVANLTLLPGDVLSIVEKTIRISVAGQVQKPGAFDLPIGGGIIEAVALAGGAAPKAALTKAVIKRADGSVVPVNLYNAMVLGEVEGNVKLSGGDLVMIPQSRAKVAVLGAVRNPGYYDIEEGMEPKISNVIAMAGGAEKRARTQEIAVMRMENGQPKRLSVNLPNVLRKGKVNEDLAVVSGDVIFVPDAKVDWDFALRAFSSMSVLGWLVR